MVSIRYQSFLLGIILTSITWLIILYLHSKITENKFFIENSSDKIAKWKLRPRVDNMHRIAQVDSLSLESKEHMLKRNFVAKRLLPERENNMIDGSDFDYDSLLKKSSPNTKDKEKKVLNSTDLVHLGMISSPQDQRTKDEGYKKHAFNLLISDRLGYRRLVPYTAHS
ncbi:Polypeptide N-acetylgalactosaminyltransferase 11, partial [Stegodyphus mimosarum]